MEKIRELGFQIGVLELYVIEAKALKGALPQRDVDIQLVSTIISMITFMFMMRLHGLLVIAMPTWLNNIFIAHITWTILNVWLHMLTSNSWNSR